MMFRKVLFLVWFSVAPGKLVAQSDLVPPFLSCDDYVVSSDDTSPASNDWCAACYQHGRDEPYFLMDSLAGTELGKFLNTRQIKVQGWTEGSFTASSASGNQLPLGFNYRANDFLLNQNWLRVARAVDKDSQEPSFGFMSDTILPGSDYRFTRARGLADNQTGSHGFDPVQFYSQAYLPNVGQGLEIRAGRFFGQYGVESIAGIDTPFVSRAYNFIYNPFTHTGLLTTLTLNDTWTVQNGIVTGSDVFFDSATEPTYIGSLKWTAADGQSSLLLATILGTGRFNQAEDFSNPQIFDLVYNWQLSEKLAYTLDALYGFQTDVPGVGTAQWYAFVNYLTYRWSENSLGTTRLELFDDVDGDRTGFEGLYTAVTTGLSYQPTRSLIMRPEIRYDYNNQSRPFDNRSGLFTAAFDFIVRW
jgi:hypothetical protein